MNQQKLSVLVIDDDPNVASVIEATVRRAGWTVTVCLQAKAAAGLAKNILPNVILCDANLPDMTGPQIITFLKSEASTAQIPIVLMTGFADAQMFAHVEWTAFIEKPFTSKDLLAVLERAAHTAIPPRIEQTAT